MLDQMYSFLDTVDFDQYAGLFVIIGVAAVILLIVDAIATGLIFQKAGKPFWHAFIPFINSYDLFEIAAGSGWAFLAVTVPTLIAAVCSRLDLAVIALIFRLIALVPSVWCTVRLGKAFGKSTGFIVGLALVPLVFELILGLDSSEYLGADGDGEGCPFGELPPGYTPCPSEQKEVPFSGTQEEAEAIAARMAASIAAPDEDPAAAGDPPAQS